VLSAEAYSASLVGLGLSKPTDHADDVRTHDRSSGCRPEDAGPVADEQFAAKIGDRGRVCGPGEPGRLQ